MGTEWVILGNTQLVAKEEEYVLWRQDGVSWAVSEQEGLCLALRAQSTRACEAGQGWYTEAKPGSTEKAG